MSFIQRLHCISTPVVYMETKEFTAVVIIKA